VPAQTIYSDNPGPIPATYSVPGDMELRLASIVARFNGASAAAAFLPCLAVYTQDDRLIGRFHPNEELAVGDTAVVTFAPFLKAAAAAANGAVEFAYSRIFRTANLTVATGSTVNPLFPFVVGIVASDSDSTVLDASTADGWIEVKTTGVYLVQVLAQWSAAFAANKLTRAVVALSSPAGIPDRIEDWTEQATEDVQVGGWFENSSGIAGEIHLAVRQESGVNQTLSRISLEVMRIRDVL
jgi:hypothetical protein